MTPRTSTSESGTGARESTRVVAVAGRKLRVSVRAGDPELAPLLLCNGIGARLELLDPFVAALDSRRPVIRFDPPGVGGSPPPVVPYHLATLPGVLAGLLDTLGHRRADVLGVSWGGGLAQQFALRHPGRVRRLVLVATGTGSLMVPARPRVLRHLLTARRYHDPAYAVGIARGIYGGAMREDPERVMKLLHFCEHPRRRGYYYQLLAGVGWTSLPVLPLLRTPTLVMAGDDDPLIPLVNARLMQRLLPRGELHVYHGGHLDLIADPRRLAPIVEAFLARPVTDPAAAPVPGR